MKTGILLLCLLTYAAISNGQNLKTIGALNSIGPYEIDDNGNITFMRIVDLDSLSKDAIFNRAEEYFTYHYGHGESVLQVNDRESGRLLGKGLYLETAYIVGLALIKVDTWHVLRIDVKDGKARLTISLTEYKVFSSTGETESVGPAPVTSKYPFDKKGGWKNAYGQAFAESYKRANLTLDSLEKTLRGGTTYKDVDKDW